MRARGEIRTLLAQTYAQYAPHGGVTWREAAAVCGVGFDAARATTKNMVRAHALRACDVCKTAQGNTLEHRYAPTQQTMASPAVAELVQAVASWAALR
jgi:hypothetical protein